MLERDEGMHGYVLGLINRSVALFSQFKEEFDQLVAVGLDEAEVLSGPFQDAAMGRISTAEASLALRHIARDRQARLDRLKVPMPLQTITPTGVQYIDAEKWPGMRRLRTRCVAGMCQSGRKCLWSRGWMTIWRERSVLSRGLTSVDSVAVCLGKCMRNMPIFEYSRRATG